MMTVLARQLIDARAGKIAVRRSKVKVKINALVHKILSLISVMRFFHPL